MTEVQDIELAKRIATDDSEAENELFRKFAEKINFMVQIRLKGRVSIDDQEDICSEILEAVLLSLRKGGYNSTTGKPLGAYIAGIVHNIIGQYFRKMYREKIIQTGLPDEVRGNPGDTLDDIVNKERNEKLKICLSKLKPKYKEVLLLRIYDNLSVAAIAERLNLDPRRVSERINYALRLFIESCKKEKYFSIFSILLQI